MCCLQALGDYRHVDSSTLSPPWCLTVRASGHTFAPESETFHPKVTFDPSSVVFPATTAGRPVHRTVVWRNHGDTPVLFDIAKDSKGYITAVCGWASLSEPTLERCNDFSHVCVWRVLYSACAIGAHQS